jgi:hypothetical protein
MTDASQDALDRVAIEFLVVDDEDVILLQVDLRWAEGAVAV